MEITLISTASSTLNMGMRCISSNLISKGHKVNLVFFPYEKTFEGDTNIRKQRMLFEALLEVCKSSKIIGLSLTTIQFEQSVKLSKFLRKRTNKLIAWGGIHPTLCPAECIKFADVVCIGDGEDSFLELVERLERKKDYSDIRGLWIKQGRRITKNPIRDVNDNLNSYPPMDYSVENKWLLRDGKLVKLTYELQKDLFAQTHLTLKTGKKCYTYVTQASRGCPHKCAYCSNAFFLKKFKDKGKILRRRNTKSLMKELKAIKKTYPFINSINFYDDTFFATSDEVIEDFSKAYKKEISVPFFALASPLTLTEKKLRVLIDAGLGHVQMGVQSGSERVNKCVYNRPIPNKFTMERMHLINKYKHKIVPQYDFIVDNPYETNEDKLETVRFISKIPKPFKIQLFSLVLYPHTELYNRAVKDGIFKEEMGGKKKSLAKFSNIKSMDFYSFLVGLSPNIPTRIFKVFTNRAVFILLNQPALSKFYGRFVKFAIKLNRKFKITQQIMIDR